MKRILLYLFLSAVMIFVLTECKKKDDDNECPACPVVNSISPASAHWAEVVTITGVNFSSSISGNIVKFNGMLVESDSILSANSTEIRVKVPKGCGSGPVTVDLDADLTNNGAAVNFTYLYTVNASLFA